MAPSRVADQQLLDNAADKVWENRRMLVMSTRRTTFEGSHCFVFAQPMQPWTIHSSPARQSDCLPTTNEIPRDGGGSTFTLQQSPVCARQCVPVVETEALSLSGTEKSVAAFAVDHDVRVGRALCRRHGAALACVAQPHCGPPRNRSNW